jgi:Fe-S-cluster-containing hydrogenase component 2
MSGAMSTSYLVIHAERCTGCRICEGVCSMTQAGVLNRAKSRIRVRRTDVLELSQKVCDQCEERPCMTACPAGAIVVKDRQVRLRRSTCDGCVEVCDKLFLAPDASHAMMCNQCGACVAACPENALELGTR